MLWLCDLPFAQLLLPRELWCPDCRENTHKQRVTLNHLTAHLTDFLRCQFVSTDGDQEAPFISLTVQKSGVFRSPTINVSSASHSRYMWDDCSADGLGYKLVDVLSDSFYVYSWTFICSVHTHITHMYSEHSFTLQSDSMVHGNRLSTSRGAACAGASEVTGGQGSEAEGWGGSHSLF